MLQRLGSNDPPDVIVYAGKRLATVDKLCLSFEEKISGYPVQYCVHYSPAFGKDLSKLVEVQFS